MTVGSILRGAFRLIRERPGALLIWIAIQLVVAVATSFIMVAIVNGQIGAYLAGASQGEIRWGILWQSILVGLVGVMVSSILFAAAQRAVLRPEEGGPGSLRLGMDEVRTFLLTFLYMAVFTVAMFVILLGLAIFMGGMGPGGQGTAALLILVIAVVTGAYFGTKLSLTYPLTLVRESFAVGEGWSLTQGRFWTLFGAYLIIFLILLGLAMVTLFATEWEYFQAVIEHGINSPEADAFTMREYEQLNAGEINAQIILTWVMSAVQGGLAVALCAGAVATAAQELTADEDGLTDTFS